jgi:CubicO group peptidase (beta-lactamase class C family)
MIRLLILLVWPAALFAGGPFTRATDISAEGEGFALLVMIDGKIVHEDYRGPGGKDRASELASGTKSFSGVLALCAVEDQLLNLDEKAAVTLTEWADDPKRRDLTLRQLLTLTSGIPGRTLSNPVGPPPSYREAITVPARWPPGEKYHYGPVPFQIFGEILRRKLTVQNETVEGYLRKKILAPLDIKPAAWRHDADGQPHLPSGAALTARDWAKFGEMIRLDGRGVLPPGKLDVLFHGTVAKPGYGLTWWLPAQGDMGTFIKRDVFTAGLPRDIRVAAGAGGQRLVVIPSLKLVAVRLAPVRLREAGFDEKAWLAELVSGGRRTGTVRETIQ